VVMGGIGPTPGPLDNVLAGAPIGPRLLTALAVVARYARRLVWPLGLSADYSYRQVELATGLGDPGALAGLGVVVGAAALAAWGRRHERPVCLALALAALPYAIVSNVFVTIGTVMAERLLYLPSAGFCLLVASAADALGRPSRARLGGGAIVVAALVAFYVPATVLRNRVWRERRGFFEALVASAPRSARSHRELGLVYSDLGLHERAIAELERALAILPGEMVNLYDLGNVLLRAGRWAEAIAAYRKALAQQADFVPAISNLGNAYSAAGDERSAESWFRAGLARAPRTFDLRLNLANSLVRQGRLAEAEPSTARRSRSRRTIRSRARTTPSCSAGSVGARRLGRSSAWRPRCRRPRPWRRSRWSPSCARSARPRRRARRRPKPSGAFRTTRACGGRARSWSGGRAGDAGRGSLCTGAALRFGRMLRVRYTAWDGTQEIRLEAERVFEKLAEYLSFTDDVQQALDWLLHQGLEWEQGVRVMGLDDFLEQLREARRSRYREVNLREAFGELREKLEELLDLERDALDRLAD